MAEFQTRSIPARVRGFTLIEVMAAVLILTFGLTSLLGLMTLGVSTRRSAEQISRAVFLIDGALQHVQEDVFGPRPGAADADPDDPAAAVPGVEAPAPLDVDQIPGMPGMSYRVEFTVDPEDPDMVLARIEVRWREQGEQMAETFQRVLTRHEPFAKRIARTKQK